MNNSYCGTLFDIFFMILNWLNNLKQPMMIDTILLRFVLFKPMEKKFDQHLTILPSSVRKVILIAINHRFSVHKLNDFYY